MFDRVLASTRKGLFALVRANSGWRVERASFLGENVTNALVDARDGTWYAALDLGHFGVKLHRSRDAGASWSEVAVPIYPEGESVATADGKPPVPATLKLLWTLESGGPEEPGRLWAGTIPGGLFRSDDAGESWQLVRGLWDRPERGEWFGGGYDQPGIHSICVDPRDARVVRVAISCGGVWTTRDGGATWEVTSRGMFADYMPPERREDPAIQDPHRMVQSRAAPDAFWVQHHNGVFASNDGAASWRHVPAAAPSGFGFAVGAHPLDPATAWFVPAIKDERRVPVDGKLVVSRTRDGGRTFEVLGAGLPQVDAYDLVYRHGLAVDGRGERLVIGSTTGGLWIGERGGEAWRSVDARLPPIHATCFA